MKREVVCRRRENISWTHHLCEKAGFDRSVGVWKVDFVILKADCSEIALS